MPLAQGFLFARPQADFGDLDQGIAEQLAAFADQTGDTLHRLIETVPTIRVEESASRNNFV